MEFAISPESVSWVRMFRPLWLLRDVAGAVTPTHTPEVGWRKGPPRHATGAEPEMEICHFS